MKCKTMSETLAVNHDCLCREFLAQRPAGFKLAGCIVTEETCHCKFWVARLKAASSLQRPDLEIQAHIFRFNS